MTDTIFKAVLRFIVMEFVILMFFILIIRLGNVDFDYYSQIMAQDVYFVIIGGLTFGVIKQIAFLFIDIYNITKRKGVIND